MFSLVKRDAAQFLLGADLSKVEFMFFKQLQLSVVY